jgi:hypothetical protein
MSEGYALNCTHRDAGMEFLAVPGGTQVLLTEQGAFFDGLDSNEQRQEGAQDSLDQLAAYLTPPR